MLRNEEGHPRGDGPISDAITDLRMSGGRPTRGEVDQAHADWWFRFGHSIGWRDGIEVGRNQVLTVIFDGRDDTRRRLGRLAREPEWAELERFRREPGGELWSDNLAACGGREYLGGPVPLW